VSVYFGPLYEECPRTESPVLNARTIARDEYTQALSAIYPWTDIADLRIFLMGFEAGEQWSLHHRGISRSKHPSELSSWLDLPSCGQIPQRVYQRIKASSGRTSVVTPAAIAGVTRKLK
jgi:hypothetical protein